MTRAEQLLTRASVAAALRRQPPGSHDPRRQERRRRRLPAVPSMSKMDLVERFDEIVTDRRLRLADVRAFVDEKGEDLHALLHGRYRVAATSGSTGQRTLLVFDRREWVHHIARAARARALAGPMPSVGHPPRAAKVASTSPLHMSFKVGETMRDPRRPVLRLSAAAAIEDTVRKLNEFQPDVLTAYPSVLRELALEQQTGRLQIAPARLFTSGELLSGAVRELSREAWGEEPFDAYVLSEAGTVAADCSARSGMHIDDDVIVERGEHDDVLLTVLTSRTLPLVRYAVGDRFTVDTSPCECGRSAPRIVAFEGREREVLTIGGRRVHPHVFHRILDAHPVSAWRVAIDGDFLKVLVTDPHGRADLERIRDELAAAVTVRGLSVQVVGRLERAASGKASLVTTTR
jgi:phenylacetate-CoA ligase